MKVRSYLMTVFDGMAKGLFASLIIGVIIERIGILTHVPQIVQIGIAAKYMMGPCIGFGIALKRKVPQFTLIAAGVAGALGAGMFVLADGVWGVKTGDPLSAAVAAVAALETGRLIEGKTKLDLLIIPAAVIAVGGLFGLFVSPWIAVFMEWIGQGINAFTVLQPLLMGVLLGVSVGMALTLPISSAALCIMISINGLAAGAAVAGCCAQMVGFAVISFRENGVGGLFTQGLGTSMVQMPNIVRSPRIWIPPTIASAVCGALSTMVFHMETDKVGAGMGTSGLVGQFTTVSVMGTSVSTFAKIGALHFIIPAAIALAAAEFMRRKGWIKPGDLKLN